MRAHVRMTLAGFLSLVVAAESFAAVRGEHVAYVGGTVSGLKQGLEGTLDTSDAKELHFDHKGGQFSVPYEKIASMEFGQKVGRRVGAAIGGLIVFGLPGLIILMSKKKKHYLTIGYRNDAGEGQAAVFELAKATVSNVLPSLEARTGKRVEMEAATDDGGFEVGHAAAPHVPGPSPVPRVAPITSLNIQSNPSGAEVFIDAKNYGSAPVTTTLPPGLKYVVLRLNGFDNWTREIEAKAGDNLSINGDLQKTQESPNVIVVKAR